MTDHTETDALVLDELGSSRGSFDEHASAGHRHAQAVSRNARHSPAQRPGSIIRRLFSFGR